mgnify:CR=1 FL=1
MMKYNKENLTRANSYEFQKLEEYDRVIDRLKQMIEGIEEEKSELFYAIEREKEEIKLPILEIFKKIVRKG